jgi:hypothetical protein
MRLVAATIAPSFPHLRKENACPRGVRFQGVLNVRLGFIERAAPETMLDNDLRERVPSGAVSLRLCKRASDLGKPESCCVRERVQRRREAERFRLDDVVEDAVREAVDATAVREQMQRLRGDEPLRPAVFSSRTLLELPRLAKSVVVITEASRLRLVFRDLLEVAGRVHPVRDSLQPVVVEDAADGELRPHSVVELGLRLLDRANGVDDARRLGLLAHLSKRPAEILRTQSLRAFVGGPDGFLVLAEIDALIRNLDRSLADIPIEPVECLLESRL